MYFDAGVVFCQQVLYCLFFTACFVMKGIEIQIDSTAKDPIELYNNF